MTTFATDDDVQTMAPIAQTALDALNVWRTSKSLGAKTLDDYRTLAYAEILRALRARNPSITSEAITRPAALMVPEVALTAAILCEAASARTTATSRTQNVTPDTFAEGGATWRERYVRELAAASPVDLNRGVGASFSWARR